MDMLVLHAADIFNREGYHLAETFLTTDALTFAHRHDFFELFLVTEGRLAHLVNGEEQLFGEGALCLVHPDDAHRYRRVGEKGARFINLAYTREWHERALAICGEDAPPPKVRQAQLSASTARALETLMQSLGGGMGALNRPATPALMGLLLTALGHLGAHNQRGVDAPAWLVDAMRTLRTMPCADQNIGQLIRLCGRTQEHVGRAMRRCYGTTPTEFVNSLRLGEAARLLKTSELSVLEIQLECGFDSTSHFNQRFKREYASSPSRYRKLNRAVIDPKRD
jgi:AraC family cel operon transcriptional repressor